MKKWILLITVAVMVLAVFACQPPKTEPVRPVKIGDGDLDPANWGKAYPIHYELWKKTEEPTQPGKSKYKRGFDADAVTYDKLSEFPYHGVIVQRMGIRC